MNGDGDEGGAGEWLWGRRGAKSLYEGCCVIIYIVETGERSGPNSRLPSHDHGDQPGSKKRLHLALQGSLGCHLNVISFLLRIETRVPLFCRI